MGSGRFLRGFSLVELVLVIAIIGVLSAIALPRFNGTMARNRLQSAAQRVAADLNLAQRQARLSSGRRKVVFLPTTNAYRVPGVAHPFHPTLTYEVQLDEEPYGVQIAAVDFDGDAEVIFNGFGEPDSGGTVVLASGGYQMTVVLNMEDATAVPATESAEPLTAATATALDGKGKPPDVDPPPPPVNPGDVELPSQASPTAVEATAAAAEKAAAAAAKAAKP